MSEFLIKTRRGTAVATILSEFEYIGLRVIIHRPLKEKTMFTTSEYSTGTSLSYHYSLTKKQAKEEAIENLDGIGIDRIKEYKKRFEVLNK